MQEIESVEYPNHLVSLQDPDDPLIDGERARYRERGYLCAPADPVLVGVNTLQHWLWNRIGSPATELALANA